MEFLGDLAFGDDVGDYYLLARLHHVRHITNYLNLISEEAEGTFTDRNVEGAFLKRHFMDVSLSEGGQMTDPKFLALSAAWVTIFSERSNPTTSALNFIAK